MNVLVKSEPSPVFFAADVADFLFCHINDIGVAEGDRLRIIKGVFRKTRSELFVDRLDQFFICLLGFEARNEVVYEFRIIGFLIQRAEVQHVRLLNLVVGEFLGFHLGGDLIENLIDLFTFRQIRFVQLCLHRRFQALGIDLDLTLTERNNNGERYHDDDQRTQDNTARPF